jgi:PBP1b-binding outer membrane lipoprotein LpoB
MHSTLPAKQTDDPHDFVVVPPDLVQVAPADDELSNLVRDLARVSSAPQTDKGSEGMGSDFTAVPPVPPVDTTFRASAVNDVLASRRPRPIGTLAARTFTALLLAGCAGVAAIGWESYGDAAKAMISNWTPQFVLTSLPLEKLGLSAPSTPPAVEATAANAASPQAVALAQTAPQGVAANAAPSPESTQSLQSMARDLASVGQEVVQLKASIEQLKASQQQMSRDVAKVSEQKNSSEQKSFPEQNKTSAQNAQARISPLPPRPAVARAHKPVQPFPPAQAAIAPPLPQPAAPSVPRQSEPLPPAVAQLPAEPGFSSVPRPPLPLR